MNKRRQGITAVEVLVSTLLASLLMVAMLSVLRGLKAQAVALETRLPVPTWQATLNAVLQYDLENSRTYELTNSAIILRGFAGRDAQAWKPTTVIYEIAQDGTRPWLVRRELTAQHRELVLADVAALRVGFYTAGEETTSLSATTNPTEAPIVDGLVLEFWSADQGGPLYGYRFRRP